MEKEQISGTVEEMDEEKFLERLVELEVEEDVCPRKSDWDRTINELKVQIKAMKQQLQCTLAMYAAAKLMRARAPGPKAEETPREETPEGSSDERKETA